MPRPDGRRPSHEGVSEDELRVGHRRVVAAHQRPVRLGPDERVERRAVPPRGQREELRRDRPGKLRLGAQHRHIGQAVPAQRRTTARAGRWTMKGPVGPLSACQSCSSKSGPLAVRPVRRNPTVPHQSVRNRERKTVTDNRLIETDNPFPDGSRVRVKYPTAAQKATADSSMGWPPALIFRHCLRTRSAVARAGGVVQVVHRFVNQMPSERLHGELDTVAATPFAQPLATRHFREPADRRGGGVT